QVEPALKLLRQRLADVDADDLRQRLAETEKDVALLRELERLFYRRWQVVQQVVLQQLQSGQRDEVLTRASPAPVSAGNKPAVSKSELRRDYAAAFAGYGLTPDQTAGAELVQRVKASRIQRALIDALDQWFLLEPESAALLAALNTLDAPRSAARQLMADSAAGRQPRTELTRVEQNKHEPTTALYL